MSSVVVGWTGRCPDPEDRARLIAHLERLAEVSDSYLRNRLPERCHRLEPRRRVARASARRARANIDHVNRTDLRSDRDLERDRARSATPSSPPRARRTCRQSIIPNSSAPRSPGSTGARLSGIDFRLYDPSQLHPGADRLSFVFLETEAAPFLDGRLVQVDRAPGPRCGDHPRGGFYLGGPNLHLHAISRTGSTCCSPG